MSLAQIIYAVERRYLTPNISGEIPYFRTEGGVCLLQERLDKNCPLLRFVRSSNEASGIW